MDAVDQLLLSEGVCQQLGIITYHPAIQSLKANKGAKLEDAIVPSIRVRLVWSVKLLPGTSAIVPAKLHGPTGESGKCLLVEGDGNLEGETGLTVEDAIVPAPKEGIVHLVLANLSGLSQVIGEGELVGEAQPADVLVPDPEQDQVTCDKAALVRKLSLSREQWRKKKLMDLLEIPRMPLADLLQLQEFVTDNHNVFSLEDGERRETDLVSMNIDTEGAPPRKQVPRRMPFIVHQEVAKQLKKMQKNGVIQPSSSPWSSLVVIVRIYP